MRMINRLGEPHTVSTNDASPPYPSHSTPLVGKALPPTKGAGVQLECELSADLQHVYLLLAELNEPDRKYGFGREELRAQVTISAGGATLARCTSAAGQRRGTSVVWGQLLQMRIGEHRALQLSSDLKVSIKCGTSTVGVAEVLFRATEVNSSLAQQRSFETEIAAIQLEVKHRPQQTRIVHHSLTLEQMLHARQRDLKKKGVWMLLRAEQATSTLTLVAPQRVTPASDSQ